MNSTARETRGIQESKPRREPVRELRSLAYVLSPSYSGSTLLTFLLAAHPEIATIGELKATAMGEIDTYACSCGAKIRECKFWRRLSESLAGRGIEFDLSDFGTHFRMQSRYWNDRVLRARVRRPAIEMVRRAAITILPGMRARLRAIQTKNLAIIRAIISLQGGSTFLDGSKDAVRLMYLLDSDVPDVRVIYLIRDGRGMCNSYMRHYNVPMETAAVEWVRTHRECDWVLRRVSAGSQIRIRYEDLCLKPPDLLGALHRFLGVEHTGVPADFRTVDHHILGNSMRLRNVGEIGLDEKWRSKLTTDDLAVFDRIGGALNRGFGYE